MATVAIGLSGALIATTAVQASPTQNAQQAANTNSDVQVIAFQQTWNSIANECTDVYGPEGVGYVEISPATETITGTSWWTSYQPVSYKLDSKLGTEAEFKHMITTCKAAGVGIIADVVTNQTTGTDSGVTGEQTGVAGTTYNPTTVQYPGFTGANNQYPNGATREDFHDCKTIISDYTNQDQVQNCRLNSMWDWDTSSAKVQDIDSDFLAGLLKLGVAGFRMDAAKHINPQDLAAIKAQTAQKAGLAADDIYWIQETIGNASEAAGIQPNNYTGNGEVTEFGFSSELNQKFKGSIAELKDLSQRLLPSDQANVFVSNWDTARNSSTLTYKDGARYQLANAFMLAYGYGTPRLLSDYKFGDDQSGHDAGAPGATDTKVPDVDFNKACASNDSDWNCQERWTSTRGMIQFHNYVDGAAVTKWQSANSNSIAFSRSDKGFIAINNSAQPLETSYTTDLADGTYCNVYAALDCSKTVDVHNGTVTTTIPARSVVALYKGATQESHPESKVATDPSDPAIDAAEQAKLPTDQTLTVYYKADPSWPSVKMGYQANDQWSAGQEAMQGPDDQGYYTMDLQTGGKPTQVYFTDGNGNWDSNDSKNYTIAAGITQASIEHHSNTVTLGNPETLNDSTRLVVHYRPANDNVNRGLYIWGSSNSGKNLDGAFYEFNSQDAWGKVYETTLPDAYAKLNFIVTTTDGSWNKFGGDRTATVGQDGTAEVWVDGTSADGAQTTLDTAPSDYAVTGNLNLTVHYRRIDGKYYNAEDTSIDFPQWTLWTWTASSNGREAQLTSHDAFGEIANISYPQYTMITKDNGNTDIGMLRRYGEWKAKDPGDVDVFVPAKALVANASDGSVHGEIWLVQGDATVYTAQPSLTTTLKSASIADFHTLNATLSNTVPLAKLQDKVTVQDSDGKDIAVKSLDADGTAITITTEQQLAPNAAYTVRVADYGKAQAIAGSIVRTKDFDKQYAYDGTDLGATWSKQNTVFKLWAPTASQVELNTFASDQSADAALAKTYPMTRGDKGVWSVTLDGDISNTAYTYAVHFADGTVNESTDPYATAATVNGDRSVVLADSEKTIADFKRMPEFKGGSTHAVVAETHIRDFTKSATSGVDEAKRGTYLGFIQTGTKNTAGNATGLDYLKNLGITHVQLQPIFDYASVDETKPLDDSNYNWGYDPKNYNVPEGSYSSNASDPATRIRETKQMIQGIHKAGIRVIMDVVYNHVDNAAEHAFGKTVPGYYFRYTKDGNLSANTGVSNDTASERAMMRKYIVDSVTYWAKEYNVDGFRFDLMGIHDLETMKQVRAALDTIDPSIMVYGEGWDMNTMLPKEQNAIQPNAFQLDNTGGNGTKSGSTIGFFNDSLRDALRGSVFALDGTGFVANQGSQEQLVMHNILGCPLSDGQAEATKCWNGNAEDHYAQPGQLVQYAEIHDNQTLYDRLLKSVPQQKGESDADYQARLTKMDKLATGTILLSEGQAEIQVGQEFLRTKDGNENSYNAGDTTNQLNWDALDANTHANAAATAAFVKGMISVRKAIPGLQLDNYDDVAKQVKPLTAAQGVVAYQISDKTGTYVVVLNANNAQTAVSAVPAGTYTPLVLDSQVLSQAQSGTDASVDAQGFAAAPISVNVLKLNTEPADGTDTGNTGNAGETGSDGNTDNTGNTGTDADNTANGADNTGNQNNQNSNAGNSDNANKHGNSDAQSEAQQSTPLASTGVAVAALAAIIAVLGGAGAVMLWLRRKSRNA
ncbi:type I pullulanase [Galliscardovia ingluviei]|nr:type I pullulanase [Galliscardovia ingluviei]